MLTLNRDRESHVSRHAPPHFPQLVVLSLTHLRFACGNWTDSLVGKIAVSRASRINNYYDAFTKLVPSGAPGRGRTINYFKKCMPLTAEFDEALTRAMRTE